jgi:hypothetical protein
LLLVQRRRGHKHEAEGIAESYQRRREISGLRFEHRPPVLPRLTATFAPIGV